MDSINNVPTIITEKQEDRISNLSDDIIHLILGFLDMKYAVQTSELSRKWKYIWTSMPCLNFNSHTLRCMNNFGKFVEDALLHRDIRSQVSTVRLTFGGITHLNVAEYIVKYAYINNVSQITMKWFPGRVLKLPPWLFSSRTLKYLNLSDESRANNESRIPNSVWDLPALETLYIGNIRLGDGSDKNLDLFSKCVNLKDVTLHNCSMYGLESFTICAPLLSNLSITEFTIFPKVFNLAAPQLKTLIASVITTSGTMPSSFNFLRLSTEGFSSLERVNLSSSNGRYKKEKLVSPLLDLFHVVRSAKYLILDVEIIECLSSCLDQLSNEPCRFYNLKCLKINTSCLDIDDLMPAVPTQVRNYLLENSPTATFIMDLPQAYIKATNEENRRLKSKTNFQTQLIASLKTELRRKDQVIANQNADIQRKNQIIVKQNAEIQVLNFNNIRLQSDVPVPPSVPKSPSLNLPQKRSSEQAPTDTRPKKFGRMKVEVKILETIAKENKMLKEKLQICDQLIKTWKTKLQKKNEFIAKQKATMQLKDEIIAKKNADIKMLKVSNIPKQSSVPTPPPMPRLFSSIVIHKMSREQVPNDPMPKKVATLEVEKELPEGMSEKNRRLEAKIQMQYQAIADLKRELHMKDQVIANQNENIQMKDQVIGNLNANIQMKDQVIANQNANIQLLKSSKMHVQSDFHAPPPVPRPASSNVLQKRSSRQVLEDTMSMKVAKLEERIRMKDRVIASQKAIIQMNDQVIANQKTNIQMKHQVIANQNTTIQMKDQVIANQNANIQMKDQVIANQNAMIEMLKSNNIHMHSDVPEPLPGL